jgi:hypothetical protein
MKRDFRLLETDQLKNNHFPIIAFFNAIPDHDYIDVLEQLSLGVGGGYNDVVCLFPEDLDPGEEKFEGVMFSLFNEEVIVDYQTFYYYLRMASMVYLEDNFSNKEIVEDLLKSIKKKYHLI